jgi:hypothetical protein
VIERKREIDLNKERLRDTKRDREREKQSDRERETEKQSDRMTERETDRQKIREICTYICCGRDGGLAQQPVDQKDRGFEPRLIIRI